MKRPKPVMAWAILTRRKMLMRGGRPVLYANPPMPYPEEEVVRVRITPVPKRGGKKK